MEFRVIRYVGTLIKALFGIVICRGGAGILLKEKNV